MRAADIRSRFLAYFERQGHLVRPSSSLVPADGPTLLFTNSGMVPFKKVFLAEGVVPGGVPHLLEVVVLAAGAHALLRGRHATPERRLFEPEEHALELHHPRVGEQQRRVVGGHERRARTHHVPLPLEVPQEPLSDL